MSSKRAIFAAGCFWGVEQTFSRIPGVLQTTVGYTGGQTQNPTYEAVCSDSTGHAEAVAVDFDPQQVSYEQLLEVFWRCHDPTTPNRQGPDVGSQYRSAIFTDDEEQQQQAQRSLQRAQQRSSRRVVTEVTPASTFWPAEQYHQQYLRKRGLGH